MLAALTPLMECFDFWDKNPGPASDTEIHVTAWFVGVGIVLTIAKLLRHIPVFAILKTRQNQVLLARQTMPFGDYCFEPRGSPPLISLRI
jgi:hypothetical protein